MPVATDSMYHTFFPFTSGHLQTIYPTLFRKVRGVAYTRERINTPDDDFLDLDWSRVGGKKLAILSHGLEGDSRRHYMLGMVRALNRHGWDALAWNYRGCSGEPNRTVRFYHSGATEDLHTVIEHVLSLEHYQEIALIGLGGGGNMTVTEGGARGETVHSRVSKGIAFSVPCDLKASSEQLAKLSTKLYMERFIRSLHEKIKAKMTVLPGMIDDAGYETVKTFYDFDDRYTAPLHGFRDAEDYWAKCSSARFIEGIRTPALLVNPLDDPFLKGRCYPVEEARNSKFLTLEMPKDGGHVGFIEHNKDGLYWSERRAISFLDE